MKWLKSVGCPWNEYTVMKAVEIGNDTIIDWLIDNGCPYCSYSIYSSTPII